MPGTIPPRLLALLLLVWCVPRSPPAPAGRSAPPARGPAAPRQPAAGPRVVDLQYGGSFCALRDDGRVACWGQNAGSSLGDGSNEARSRPALLAGLDQVQKLRGLPSLGFCALRSDA